MSKGTRYKIWSLTAVILIAALAFTGCGSSGGNDAAPTPPGVYVKDTAGVKVAGAWVYAIPSADVAELAAQPITLTAGNYTTLAQTVDEPLEDLINANFTPTSGGVSSYMTGTTDVSGKVELSSLPTGTETYFLYVKPDAGDTEHLPGGSLCRTAVTGASLQNKATTIKISTSPTSSATYIGSSACIVCHASYATEKKTLHKLGIMVPNSPGASQDLTKFSSATDPDQDFFAGLKKFESGTTVHYYTTGVTTTTSAFKTLASSPSGTITEYFTLDLFKTGAVYQVRFNNIINTADTNDGMVQDVVLTYGGGLHKQRYLVKLGNSLYVLPLQFNSEGSDSSADPTRTVWVEYNTVSNKWWDVANNVFTIPNLVSGGLAKSFDISCAGCHFTGYSVTKNGSGEYLATGAADSNGELHPVAGTNMEMNVGCEVCHGPGSEHQAASGQGKFIVTPSNLTPERELMICGTCHTRSESKDPESLKKENPLDANYKMMKPGTSRANYLANNVSRHDALYNATLSSSDLWGDAKHSKKHHQQYTDFIQTKKYRNGTALKTCAGCHDVHAPGTDRHQLSGTSDNTLCTSCHTTVVLSAHMTAKTGADMGIATKCVNCHSTKTAKSGSGNPTPGYSGTTTKYYQNDITSHLFDVPQIGSISSSNAMPIPYTTNGCTGCHTNLSGL